MYKPTEEDMKYGVVIEIQGYLIPVAIFKPETKRPECYPAKFYHIQDKESVRLDIEADEIIGPHLARGEACQVLWGTGGWADAEFICYEYNICAKCWFAKVIHEPHNCPSNYSQIRRTPKEPEIGACLECKLEAENAKLRARIEKLETVLSQTLGEVVGNEGRLPLDKWEYANKILFNEQAEKEGK